MISGTGSITDLRLRLRAAGYDPIPCEGKIPPLAGWQERTGASVDDIRLWGRLWSLAHNTGVLCKRTPCIDIDVLDEVACEAIERLAREHFEQHGTVLVRFGQSPKRAIPLKADKPFKKMQEVFIAPNGDKHMIEILGDGQQFVAFGNHPSTGQPYSWFGGSLDNVAREELPDVSENDLKRFLAEAADILINKYDYRRLKDEKAKGNGNGATHANDGAKDWAGLTQNILAGASLHDSLLTLAGKLVASGMSAGATINYLHGLLEASTAAHDPRWQERFDDVERLVDGAVRWQQHQQQQTQQTQQKLPPLPFIDMSTWDAIPAAPREWAVYDRIPTKQPTLFTGEGGGGKSTIDLQLCVAHVLGRDWFGTMPALGPAIYFGCEDHADELQRRLTGIADFYGAKFADLIAGGLHLLSYAGEDGVLAVPNRSGLMVPTPLFNRLLEAAGDLRPQHLGLDTSADVFAGNEIDRSQVRQFMSLLRKLAVVGNSGVVLLAHPSLTGINSGSGYSGSTAWHNSSKGRMYLKSAPAEDGGKPDPDLRELQFLKNSYGPPIQSITLRWNKTFHMFLPERSGDSAATEAAAASKADTVFLALLDRFTKQNRVVNDRPGRSYAPSLFAMEAEAKGFSRNTLAAAMRRLLAANRIHLEAYGPPSRERVKLAAGPATEG